MTKPAPSGSKRFGAIGVFGRANAGKSTLVNALVGEKVSIVSPRPQTTRRRVLGILTIETDQIVFCDTPGLHQIRNRLDSYMDGVIRETIPGLHGAIFVVDSSAPALAEDRDFLEILFREAKIPIALCLNKADLSTSEDRKKLIAEYQALGAFAAVFEIAAIKAKKLDALRDKIREWLPAGAHGYDADFFTASSEREIAAESIREAALRLLLHEVPHAIAVLIEEFKERDNGKTFIQATLVVERDSQKKIIIGAAGKGIKKLGSIAREELNRILGRDIFLELWVKVRPNWRKNADLVRQMGYS